MKLRTLCILVLLFQLASQSVAQRITLNEKNSPLIEVINRINIQTGYDFLFTTSAMAAAKPVSLHVTDAGLREVLQKIFDHQPLDFIIKDMSVVIVKKGITYSDSTAGKEPSANRGALSGSVTDSLGNKLEGATLTLVNTKFHTTSKKDGSFRLSAIPSGRYTLLVTYIGFAELSLPVEIAGPHYTMQLVMQPGTSSLDQVSVIAYGLTTRRISIGSVSTIGAKEIAQQPVDNFLQALQGRVAGLIVTPFNGGPGSMYLAQIRGQNTLANSSVSKYAPININQPLYLLDGQPLTAQNMVIGDFGLNNSGVNNILQNSAGLSPLIGINPMDIESISVLKDADATSIYGSQGSNGVILITTKKGKPGPESFDLAVQTGSTVASRTVPMMNTPQYLEMRKEAVNNSGLQPTLANNDADLLLFDPGKYTDYRKEFYGGMGHKTEVNTGFSGGTDRFTYLVNLGDTHESYNFPGGFANNRLSLHSAFDRRSTNKRLAISFGTDYSYDKNNSSGAPFVLYTPTLPPNTPDLQDNSGRFLWDYKGYSFGGNNLYNVSALLKQTAYTELSFLNMHLIADYRLFPWLKILISAGYSHISDENYAAFPYSTQDPALRTFGYTNSGNSNGQAFNIEPQLNVNRQIGRGVLDFLLGGTYRRNSTSARNLFVYGYTNDALLNSVSGGTTSHVSNQGSIYKYDAVFARLNYIWDNKYIFNFTANRNGSSNFGPNHRFGNFGSAGLGWIATEEGWLKNWKWLSFAKITANYGTSGSDGIAPYQYQPNWAPVSSNGYQGMIGYYPVTPQNSSYAWSLNRKFNASLDLGFLKNSILLNFTSYINNVSNQLVSYNQPIQTGFDNITANAPYEVENSGFEFTISTKNISNKVFQWSSGFNITHNANKLKKFPDITTTLYRTTYVPGHSLNSIPLVPFTGVDPVTGIFTFKKADGSISSRPDPNTAFNNGTGDATRMLNPDPVVTGGLINTFTYKEISLTVFFQFAKQTGLNILSNIYSTPFGSTPGNPNNNEPALLTGRWRRPGDVSPYQRVSEGAYSDIDRTVNYAANVFRSSTGAWSDASYIRLKTLSLEYTMPASVTRKLHIKGSTLFIKGQNLFLITRYKLIDPETQSIFNIPPQRTIVAGLNLKI